MSESYRHLRPTTHTFPKCLVRCAICGACLDLHLPNKPPMVVRDFMQEHLICIRENGPAAACVVPECWGIGLGPMQRCADHGGKRSLKHNR